MMKILYEDNHIIVAVKDGGILSQAGDKDLPDMLTLLKAYIKEKYNKPGNVYLGLVHRLDINTKGIMVFARTSKAAERLNNEIKNHDFSKSYYALVEGKLENKEFLRLDAKLSKDENTKKAYIDNKNGKEASLEYRVIDNIKHEGKDLSILDIRLITGRFHQIRCQFSSIGHPLYGDYKYGSKNKVDIDYTLLYAYKLEFNHPTTKERLTFVLDEALNEIRTNL